MAAILLAQQVERGTIDPSVPMAEYWPEFAAGGKQDVTVAQAVSHQAGLPAVDTKLTLEQVLAWDPIVDALAAQTPLWEPGTDHGYHALTYGWIVGELLRRVTGIRPGELLAKEASDPLELDLWFGLPEDEESRVSHRPCRAAHRPRGVEDGAPGHGTGHPRRSRAVARRDLRKRLEQAGGPRGGAPRGKCDRRCSVLGPPVRGLHRRRRRGAPAAAGDGRPGAGGETSGPDKCLIVPTNFGLGFMLPSDFEPLGGPGSFGHPGAGGSVAWALPEQELAFAYVMNRMGAGLAADPRGPPLGSRVGGRPHRFKVLPLADPPSRPTLGPETAELAGS